MEPVELQQDSEFEFPSPKKARLEKQQSDETQDPTTPIDDEDDLYHSSPKPLQPKQTSAFQNPKPYISPILSQTVSQDFQLPGLGLVNNGHNVMDHSGSNTAPETHPAGSISTEKQGIVSAIKELQNINRQGELSKKSELEVGLQLQDGLELGLDHHGDSGPQSSIANEPRPEFKEAREPGDTASKSPKSVQLPDPGEGPLASIDSSRHNAVAVQDTNSQAHQHQKDPEKTTDFQLHTQGPPAETQQHVMSPSQSSGATVAVEDHLNFSLNNSVHIIPGISTSVAQSSSKPVIKNREPELSVNTPPSAVIKYEDRSVIKVHSTDANIGDGEAEFELDSSPIETSSDSGSVSSSSSSEASDYEMLDPEEEARRLMQEDGGSDDDGKGGKTKSEPLRTLNEKPDEIVPKPQIDVTEDMPISELGSVEHLVENSILIKSRKSGETQALEIGSLLCLEDRSVIGVVSETLGQVHQPYYAVRFTNPSAIAEAGISKGTSIFYVEQYSTFIFTQNLKAFKGSDASNMHDEEVGDDELEFSDDEAEAEHKRRVKQTKQAKRDGRGDGFAKGPRGSRGPRRGRDSGHAEFRVSEAPPMRYDDFDNGDDLYTPLARPSNLHEMMGHGEAPQESLRNRSEEDRGGHADRGRPDRGRGRGDRGRDGKGDRRGFRRGGSNGSTRNGNPHRNFEPPPAYSPYPSTFPPSKPSPTNYHHLPSRDWPNPPPSIPPTASFNQPIPSYNQQPQQPHQMYNPSPYPQTYTSPNYVPANNHYPPRQTSPTYNQYPPYQNFQSQAHSPSTPLSPPPNIPAGAHINPAFFPPQMLSQSPQWPQQQPGNSNSHSSGPDAAARAAQERLNFLRMSQGRGPPPSS